MVHAFYPSTLHLLQVMVSKVSPLFKTVKNVEDEASKGVQSLENTIDAIEAGLLAYKNGEMEAATASPEDLVRCTKVRGVVVVGACG